MHFGLLTLLIERTEKIWPYNGLDLGSSQFRILIEKFPGLFVAEIWLFEIIT